MKEFEVTVEFKNGFIFSDRFLCMSEYECLTRFKRKYLDDDFNLIAVEEIACIGCGQ